MSSLSISRGNTARCFLQFKDFPPVYLAPVFSLQSHFSTSQSLSARRKRDGNRHRGVSALRRTGLRKPVGMAKEPLPVPVMDPTRRSKITVDKEHGLWGFFNKDRTALSTPEQDASFGRSWITRFIGLKPANQFLFFRAPLGCRRAARQILGGFTLSLVGLRKGKESFGNRETRA